MFIWLRSTLPQFASYLSSFQTDPNQKNISWNADEFDQAKIGYEIAKPEGAD